MSARPLTFRKLICCASTSAGQLRPGLGVVDLIRGADFQSLHLLLALRAGEISRLARAMAFEVSQTAARGGSAREHVAELLEKTEALARSAGNPHSIGMAIVGARVEFVPVGQLERGVRSTASAAPKSCATNAPE